MLHTPQKQTATPADMGLSALVGDVLPVDSFLPFESWTTDPNPLQLQGERLFRRKGHGGERNVRSVRPSKRMLKDFLNLHDAEARFVCQFLNNYGDWGVCEHGLPFNHARPKGCEPCRPVREHHAELYRKLARVARAVGSAYASLRRKKKISDEDWNVLTTTVGHWSAALFVGKSMRSGSASFLDRERHPSVQHNAIAMLLWLWMKAAEVVPFLVWRPGYKPRIALVSGVSSQFAALGMLVMSSVSMSSGIGFCPECTKTFTPKGRARFCDACRKSGAPVRHAMKAYRDRKREERERRTPGDELTPKKRARR